MVSRFHLRVVPRAARTEAAGRLEGVPRLRVKAPPVAGAANAEVERACTKLLGARARVVAGQKSRTKTIEVDLPPGRLARALDAVFGRTND